MYTLTRHETYRSHRSFAEWIVVHQSGTRREHMCGRLISSQFKAEVQNRWNVRSTSAER
jgi:hypothetical protein